MNPEQIPEAVDEYGASIIMCKPVQTLRNERHLRKGCPYLKMGRSVRYRIEDILDYMARCRIDPESA
jgi:hypothetical protein